MSSKTGGVCLSLHSSQNSPLCLITATHGGVLSDMLGVAEASLLGREEHDFTVPFLCSAESTVVK